MDIKNNYQKFREYLKKVNLLYAFWSGIRYSILLIKKQNDRFKNTSIDTISKGKLKIVCFGWGINIFWNGCEVTKTPGSNVGINTLGLWSDSTKADWRVLEKGKDHLKIKIVFKELPLSQVWVLEIKNEHEIDWRIDVEIESLLRIDELRILCLVNSRYKTWISNYHQLDFPRLDKNWHDLYLGNSPAYLVGVRFPLEGEFLPSFILEVQNGNFFPLIQNPSLNNDAHIIGFRHIDSDEKKDFPEGHYHLFSGKINLFENDSLLDIKIENLRQESLAAVSRGKEKNIKTKRRLKVLLANLPWQRNGKWGVRAGSRWPHIKDESEGNYLPFPFFLAYSASLLQRHNIDAYLVDAIAEQISEDKFMEKISRLNFDLLVTEISTPSFYEDLNMLRRISLLDIPIVLCGSHAEIYQPQFLKQHPFINFVLCGEYEFTLLELIKCLQANKGLSKINGLIWRDKDAVIKNSARIPFDINLLPWPYREKLPMEKYLDLPGNIPFPSVQMLASRGCPFGCNFCLWPQVMYKGNHYRTRDIKDVIDEMEYLIRDKKFKSVYFDDDTFNIGKERMLKLCGIIKERGLQDTPWAIMARPDLMDKEILTRMKAVGLWAVKYGLESCSASLIKRCNKNLDLKKTDEIVKFTRALGIKIHLTFSFGVDGETNETVKRTIDYALSLDPDSVQFSIITPFPGTILFEELEKQGRILTKDWSKYDGHYRCVFKPDNLTPQDLERAKRRAYRLWGEHQREKRGFRGDIRRFKECLTRYGLRYALLKTLSYLKFVLIKRKNYLDGED